MQLRSIIQKTTKTDYYKNKKYTYERAFILLPAKLSNKLRAGQKVSIMITE